MSVFKRLLSLFPNSIPLEDFFSEIVAHTFITHNDILLSWLDQLNIVNPQKVVGLRVFTQYTMECLVHQDCNIRLDILVEVATEQAFEWVIIESKIGSSEMPGQLQHYAEQLNEYKAIHHGTLLFLTRDYEPKTPHEILKRVSHDKVTFIQKQWRDFYLFLRKQPRNEYIVEVLNLMKELGMTRSNQFTAIDIIALTSLHKVYGLMQATLNDEVKQAIQKVIDIAPVFTNVTQLQHNRYYLWAWPTSDWWIGIGFSFPPTEITDYPSLHLQIEVAAKTKRPATRQVILEAMKQIASRQGWHGYNLSATKAWSGIVHGYSLRHVLSHDDHVVESRRQCLEFVKELAEIKQQFPQLPWSNGVNQVTQENTTGIDN